MQIKHGLTALVAVVSALPTVAQAATTDPYQLIYRASGVADDGTPSGVNTVVVCTNYSAVAENVAIIFRSPTGASLYFNPATVASGATISVSTHVTSFIYPGTANAATGAVAGGYLSVGSSTVNLSCTAYVIDSPASIVVALHLVRFNPAPNSVE